MFKSFLIGASLLLTILMTPVHAAWITADDFDAYADGAPINSIWTQRTGSAAHIIATNQTGNGAITSDGINEGLITLDPLIHVLDNGPIRFDVAHDLSLSGQNTSAILAFNDHGNNLFSYLKVQFQSNNSTNNFHSILFYLIDNGSQQLGWNGMTDGGSMEPLFVDGRSFTSAKITAEFTTETVNNQDFGRVTIWVDRDPAEGNDYVVTRGGIPLNNMGTEVGLGIDGSATVDNFQVHIPEPGTLACLLLASGMMFYRRIRS